MSAPTEFSSLTPNSTFTTTWNQRGTTWLERNCIRLCGTCYTGACCGKVWMVASLIVSIVFFVLFIVSVKKNLSPTLTIVSGIGVALSIISLLIGRCISLRYTTSFQINAPFTGRPVETIYYEETFLEERESEERGKRVGQQIARSCQIV